MTLTLLPPSHPRPCLLVCGGQNFRLCAYLLDGEGMGADCGDGRPSVCHFRDCRPCEGHHLCANHDSDPCFAPAPGLYPGHLFCPSLRCSLEAVSYRGRDPCCEAFDLRVGVACRLPVYPGRRCPSCLALCGAGSLGGRPSSPGRPREVFCAIRSRWAHPTHA